MSQTYSFVLIQFDHSSLENKEILSALAVQEYGCAGIEEFSLEEARVDEILGDRAYSGGDVPESLLDEVEAATFSQLAFYFKFYFDGDQHQENAGEFVYFCKENFSEIPIHVEEKVIEDWNGEWKKFYMPIKVSENLEIIPEWLYEKNKNDNIHQIVIYPGMGFGTGTHETTFLCLALLEKYGREIKGNACLDFGCGSGILGIGAMLTHSMKVDFVDIDRSALENTLQNLNINFEGKSLEGSALVLRERFEAKKYHLVFANILENVLLLEQKTIMETLVPGSYLIVSGLLNHQVENIKNKYTEVKFVETISKGDWSAIIFRK